MCLSKRIRPDVETAPWVIDEIKAFEDKIDTVFAKWKLCEKLGACDRCEKAEKDRDAVRRELCELIGHYVTGNGCADGVNVAIERGWDCFNTEK